MDERAAQQLGLVRLDIRNDAGGGGPHYCLGASLARAQLRSIFGELQSDVAIWLTGSLVVRDGRDAAERCEVAIALLRRLAPEVQRAKIYFGRIGGP